MKLCVIGHMGSIGRRYAAICEDLSLNWYGLDVSDPYYKWPINLDDTTHFLIATPTNTHITILQKLLITTKQPKKILVEKPICPLGKTPEGIKLCRILEKEGHKVYMVNNYAYYPFPEETPPDNITMYDYFHSGNDGLIPDCIQLIYLAKGQIFLNNKSPVWGCTINGHNLDRIDLDSCYISMIEDFISDGKKHGRLWDIDDAERAQYKTIEYGESVNWLPSQN